MQLGLGLGFRGRGWLLEVQVAVTGLVNRMEQLGGHSLPTTEQGYIGALDPRLGFGLELVGLRIRGD